MCSRRRIASRAESEALRSVDRDVRVRPIPRLDAARAMLDEVLDPNASRGPV